MVSRRQFLIGAQTALLSAGAGRAYSGAPETSLIPQPRSTELIRRSVAPLAEVIADAGLPGRVGCAVADAATGEILEVFNALYPLPPASVAKAVTTAYGLDRMGPGYRFRTTLVTDGTVSDGRLDGDLWLVGGGDPVLDTDVLDEMARALAESGIREITGTFRIATMHCPPSTRSTPPSCRMWATTRPISALNLNFNRVFFEWERAGEDYTVRMDARSDSHSPMVTCLAHDDRAAGLSDLYVRPDRGGDEWTVARSALGQWRRPLAAGAPPARLSGGGVPDAGPRARDHAGRARLFRKRPARCARSGGA
jgi:D-alanyl-D-alanine carboxypeptidase/D-alanyl-D-alanine-endopeptidase (penicillin-binding protein 4)